MLKGQYPPGSPSGVDRYRHLDSLRGLAACLVLWMHGAERFVAEGEPGWTRFLFFEVPDFMHFGRVGVVIFFCLSGYLIAKSLEGGQWKVSFPIKRAFRLYPIYLFSVVAALLVMDVPWDTLKVLANLTMLPTVLGQEEMSGLYWTLQTEVIFYGVFYVATWFGLGSSARSLLMISALFASLYIASELLVEQSHLDGLQLMIRKLALHLSVMFWGACLYKSGRRAYLKLGIVALTGYILSPSFVAGGEYIVSGFDGKPPMILSYITAMMTCYAVFYLRISGRIFQGIGRISYSVYLNHGIILYLLLATGINFSAVEGMALLVLMTLALSWVTFKTIEEPAIGASRKVVEKTLRRTTRGGAVT